MIDLTLQGVKGHITCRNGVRNHFSGGRRTRRNIVSYIKSEIAIVPLLIQIKQGFFKPASVDAYSLYAAPSPAGLGTTITFVLSAGAIVSAMD